MNTPRNRIMELACNTGCFFLALKKRQFGKLRFFVHHAILAIV